MVGTLLKYRFELQSKLADGACYETWRAHDRLGDRVVVVQLLRPEYAAQEEAAARWLVEVQRRWAPARVPAPAFVEAGRDGESVFVVREFVDGPTLERWMNEPRDYPAVVETMSAALRALATWHEAGLVHGRLHPSNIVIGPGGIVFCDHGVATATRLAFGQSPSTRRNPVYLAPEARGGENVGAASDVYSMGIVLYELLTGRRLVAESATRPAASVVNAALPTSVDVVVDGMLRPDPDDRYPAAQAAQTLEKLRERAEEQAGRTPRELRRQKARERKAQARQPLPWPVVVILVFYRFLFIMLGTVLVSGVTLTFMGLGAYRYLTESIPPEVIVPDVIGMPEAEVKDLFENHLDLRYATAIRQASSRVEPGAVVSLEPRPGSRVRAGRTIQAVVSSGPDLVTVPRVVQSTLPQAEARLQRLGLSVGTVEREPHPSVPAGQIIRQEPEAGRRAESNTRVDLVLSDGAGGQTAPEPEPEPTEPVPAAGDDQRQGRVEIQVPQVGLTWVRIVVRDDRGERIVYDKLHDPGDRVVQQVKGTGQTVVEVYLNDTKVQTEEL